MHEGMADLIYLMNTLVDNKGKILIPGKKIDFKNIPYMIAQ